MSTPRGHSDRASGSGRPTPGRPGSGRVPELLRSLALAVAAAGCALLAAELLLRVSGFAPAAQRLPQRLINPGRQLLLDCYPDDPRGYFDVDLRDARTLAHYRELGVRRLQRAVERTPRCVEVRYDSDRYRGDEVPPRRPGAMRVAVLGDSFSEGQGVREADTWPSRLAAALEEAEPGRWEVVNGAHRAADFPELHELFYGLLRHEPDLVVYAMVLNDVEQSEAFRARSRDVQDWITVQSRSSRARYHRLGFLQSRLAFLVRDRIEAWRLSRATIRWYRDMYREPNRAGWASTRKRIREMDRRMRLRGGRLLVARWPLLVGFPGGYPFEETHAAIGRFLEAAGIADHDLLPALNEWPADALIVHPSDRHPNERAHAIAAQSLLGVVRALGDELRQAEAGRATAP